MGLTQLIGTYLSDKYGNKAEISKLLKELEAENQSQNFLWQLISNYFDGQDAGYKGQYRQDQFVDLYFNGKKDGYFVDIGAWDGITFSNSYFLENQGWNGILIEPNPLLSSGLQTNRKGIIENICISSKNQKVLFLIVEGYASMLSGIKDSFSAEHLERIDQEIKMFGGSKREVELDCLTLETLFNQHKVVKVDYLSIDTEGHELQVLYGINFSKVDIRLIGIELDYSREASICEFLKMNGFRRILRIQSDVFFEKI